METFLRYLQHLPSFAPCASCGSADSRERERDSTPSMSVLLHSCTRRDQLLDLTLSASIEPCCCHALTFLNSVTHPRASSTVLLDVLVLRSLHVVNLVIAVTVAVLGARGVLPGLQPFHVETDRRDGRVHFDTLLLLNTSSNLVLLSQRTTRHVRCVSASS